MVLPFPPPGGPPGLPPGPGSGAPALPPDLPPELLMMLAGGGGAMPPGGPPMGPPAGPLPPPGLGGPPPLLPGAGGPPMSPPGIDIPGGPPAPPRGLAGIPGQPQGLPDPMQMLMMMQQMQDQPEQQPAERKKEAPKKPDIEDLIAKADRIVDFWQRRDSRMDEDQRLYLMSESVEGAGQVVTKNTIYTVVEKAANMIAGQSAVFKHIPPTNDGRSTSQKVEDFIRWTWGRWDKRYRRAHLQSSIERSIAHFLCLRGWAAARINYDSENDDPHTHPVRLEPEDPRQVYPAFGRRDELLFVVHRYPSTVGELLDQYHDDSKVQSEFGEREFDEEIEITAYYDNWYHCLWVDDVELRPVTAHEYGFIPWVIVTGSGAPIRATTNDLENWTANVGVSIFHGLKGAYSQLNKLLSQLSTQIERDANPPIAVYYDPTTGEPAKISFEAGATNHFFIDRERYEVMESSADQRDVAAVLDALLDDINRAGLPPVVWGAGGNQSGFAMSIMSDAARDQLFTVIEAVQEFMTQANEKMLTLIRDFHDGDVGFWTKNESGQWVGGTTISPDDIEEVGVENEVIYRDISPRDRMAMAQMAQMLTNSKLISLETAREEYLGLDNPERENERVLTDLIYMDEDVVKKALVPMALQKAEPELAMLYQLAKQQEQMQTQVPGPGGGPPGLPPEPGGGAPPGLPPNIQPPIQQPGANPLIQSLGSVLGGQAAGPVPPGVGGGPLPPPIL